MVMDHKNLEYFSMTKVLTHCQACWSKYMTQFNLVICLRPGCLGTKPDSLTRCWDIYPKGGNSNYDTVNQSNLYLMFTQEQISVSLHATDLITHVLHVTVIMDKEQLNSSILSTLPDDPPFLALISLETAVWCSALHTINNMETGLGVCQRTPQSTSHYSRLPQQSPIHPSTQTTKPPDRSLTYVSDLRVHPTCPTIGPHYYFNYLSPLTPY